MLKNYLRGFSMAAADSVPGVSGSTVAFLLGFYDKFIFSINAVLSGKKEEKIKGLGFLGKIAVGWLTGIIICMALLSGLFEAYIYQMSSAFMGLTLFAVPCVACREKESLKGRYRYLIFTAIGIGIVIALICLNPVSTRGLSCTHPTAGALIYVFLAGMAGISAMVLPGISGSTLLLIFGVYIPILTSVKGLMSLQFEYLPILICFGAGVIAGLICVTKGISHCLKNRRSQMIYLILGLMTGSLLAIIMGPTTITGDYAPLTISNFSWISFVIGGAALLTLEIIDRRAKK